MNDITFTVRELLVFVGFIFALAAILTVVRLMVLDGMWPFRCRKTPHDWRSRQPDAQHFGTVGPGEHIPYNADHTAIVQAMIDNPVPREKREVAIDPRYNTALVWDEKGALHTESLTPDDMLEIALREQQRWSMTSGVPADQATGIIRISMADYEEQIERSRKRFSDNFRIYEEAIFKKLPPWIVRYGYEFVCLRCKATLLCVGIQVPDTIDDIKAFAREHSLCEAPRTVRDVLGEA